MSCQEGNSSLTVDSSLNSLIYGLSHCIAAGSSKSLYQSRLQECDLLGSHNECFVCTIHAASGLLSQFEFLLIALDAAHYDILMSAFTAETILICFFFFLPFEVGRMTRMCYTECTVITQSQLFCNSCSRIKDQEYGARFQHRNILSRQFFD